MAKETKSAGQKLADKLCFNPKNCWEGLDAAEERELEEFAASYKRFLDNGKTERECTAAGVELLD
jgi:hypothetical protein